MFCSKCGKEISDSAAFCDKCGNPTQSAPVQERVVERVYVTEKSESATSKISADEKERKLRAVIVFIMECLLSIGAIFIFLGEDTELMQLILNFERSSQVQALKEAIAKYDILIKILVFGNIITSAVTYYIIPFLKRNFADVFKGIVVTAIAEAICPLIIFMVLKSSEASEYISVNIFGYLLYAVYLFAVVGKAITYKKAAEAETSAYYYDKKDSKDSFIDKFGTNDDWKCKHCGTTNKSTQDYCKDCGEYK